MRIRRLAFVNALIVALLCLLSFPTLAQNLQMVLPSDPNVLKGQLSNGLTYYIRTNKKPANKVELRLVVKAGSILEDDDQQGLAHFMEHMNFNGLKHFEKNELVSYLQSIGVEFGADLNAYTSFDETVYILPIPTDKPGNLEKGFQIIEDWSHNALLTDKDINDERPVVLEESRLGKGANDRMLKKYFPKYASGTKYAERLPIGKDAILKTFKPDVLRRFYKDWYRPNLQAVMVVGDIDTATALKLIQQHFSGYTNPPNERPRNYLEPTPRSKPDAMVVSDKEAVSPQLSIIFPLSSEKEDLTLGDYKETLVRNLAILMLNQRLQDLAQSSKPPFPYASVGFDQLIHGYESFIASTTFSKDGIDQPLMALTAELIRARDYGFTAGELNRAKQDMMASMDKIYNERKTTNSSQYIDEYVRNFLTGETMPGLENEYQYYKELLPEISLTDVATMPKKWMHSLATFSLITAPQKAELKLPTDAALLAATQKGLTQKVTAPQEADVATTLLKTLPQPGKMIAKTEEKDLGTTTYTLSNGVLVTIKPTDFKSDEISLNGVKKGGTNNYGLSDKSNAQYAVSTVVSMGFGEFTPTQIDKILSGKVASVKMGMTGIEDQISGGSNIKDFETMLQLLYLRMTAPRKDEELFDAYKMKQKQQLQFLSASPQIYFLDSLYKILFQHNPLAASPIPVAKDFDAIKLDRALEIYRTEFGNAKGFHFFLVGNIQPDKALPLLEKYIGALPSNGTDPSFKDNGVRPVNGHVNLNIKKGKEKQSLVIALYHGERPYSEDFDLRAQAVAEVLNIKVIEELREKLGGIYTGGFQAEVAKEPYPHYQIMMYLPCGPENVAKLIAASNEEIKNIKENGVSEQDLEKVKSQWREKHLVSIKENGYWSGKLEAILFWGQDKNHVLDYEKWIEALRSKDIQETAKILFDGKNEFRAVLNPEP
ncbi:MAG: insulinase family protein [Bacteroidetes bacterium]|nr:insulinase family protein [Bacteroidota bacterium]